MKQAAFAVTKTIAMVSPTPLRIPAVTALGEGSQPPCRLGTDELFRHDASIRCLSIPRSSWPLTLRGCQLTATGCSTLGPLSP